jgi:hypothetical protein
MSVFENPEELKEPKKAAEFFNDLAKIFYDGLLAIANAEWNNVQFAEFKYEAAKLTAEEGSECNTKVKMAELFHTFAGNPQALRILKKHHEQHSK